MRPVLALIGDLIGSKRAPQRAALQRRLAHTLQAVSPAASALASPYTLTLGDEFQAVYHGSESVVRDVLTIMAALHPARVRFAIGVGPLATAINPDQALGMDGPAFHHARSAMEAMKRVGTTLRVEGEPSGRWEPKNHILAYVGHHMESWSGNRLAILRDRLEAIPASEMAEKLGISRVAVHKNIRIAALDDVAAMCHDLTAALQEALTEA